MSGLFDELRIFAGSGSADLAQSMCNRLGLRLGDADITKFENENIFVRLNETVRKKDVFVVQSLCSPLNDRIMELLIMLDTCKRASAGRVTAVIPYYAYGRTDKRDQPRVPITARLLADMIQTAGAQQVLTFDLHSNQIQGFFDIPIDSLTAIPILAEYFSRRNLENTIVISPDLGFVKHARNFAELLGVPLAIAEKRRVLQPTLPNDTTPPPTILNLIGNVEGRHCIIIDDEIATGQSVLSVADLLKSKGAQSIVACCVHPVLADSSIERLKNSQIQELVTTDTLPIPPEKQWANLKILSISTLLAEVIQRIHSGLSVDTMFQLRKYPTLSSR